MSKRKNPSQKEITTEDWLAELAKLGVMGPQGDGLTMLEICERLGISRDKARKLLTASAAKGQLAVTRKRMLALDGVFRLVPAYKRMK